MVKKWVGGSTKVVPILKMKFIHLSWIKCFNERKKGFGMRFGIQDLDIMYIQNKKYASSSSKNSTMWRNQYANLFRISCP